MTKRKQEVFFLSLSLWLDWGKYWWFWFYGELLSLFCMHVCE